VSRPRALVIPGLNGSPDLLMAAAPRLFPGLRALPFDHRRELAEGGVEGLAGRALAVLDADPGGDEPAYVCGESFGGTIALTLARRYPARVRGLILFSAFGRYSPRLARGGRVGLACWRLLGDRVAGGVLRVSRPLRAPGTLGFRFSRRDLRNYLRETDGHPPAYRSKCDASLRFDARPWLGSLACPTMILTGTWDSVVPISAGAELARLIPNARLHRLPGGHVVHLTRAAEVGRLIARWVAETEGSGVSEAASRRA
jgi:pimeloyl-ACP methyl ester carboxylesterase